MSNYRLTALDLNSGTDTSSSWQQQNKERFNVSLSALAVERTNRRLFFFLVYSGRADPFRRHPDPSVSAGPRKILKNSTCSQANVPVNDCGAVGVGSYRVFRCVGATDLQADLFVVQRTEGREKWTIQAIGLQLTWTGSGGRE